jgi:sulfonate transport system permease protein
MRRIRDAAPGLAFAVALLALWQAVASLRLISPVFFPGPDRAVGALLAMARTGELWAPLGETLLRTGLGWLASCTLGVGLGAAIASSRLARDLFEPTAEFLRPLPASAILPVAMLLLGLTREMTVAVIAFGALWPVLLGTIHGFTAVEPRLKEVGRALQLSPLRTFVSVSIPSALPDIFASARVSLAIALILAVVSEMLASQPGLGHLILLAARMFRSDQIFAGVIVLGAIGFVTSAALQAIEARCLRWCRLDEVEGA